VIVHAFLRGLGGGLSIWVQKNPRNGSHSREE
jgi:hypothetical protein